MRSRIFSLMFVLLALFAVTFSASAQRLCETLVEDALDDTDDNCDLTQPNDACYGFDTLDSYFFTEGDFEFRSPADLIRLGELHTVHSQPLDLESDEWGVGYFEMKATLHTQTDEAINVLMLGDVAMENAIEPEDITEFEVFGVTTASDVTPQHGFVDGSAQFANSIASGTTLDADALSPDEQWVRVAVNNETAWIPITALADAVVVEDLVSLGDEGVRNAMQDIFFTTGGISDCTDAPNTVVIQGPEEGDFELTVNGVPMRASSTLIFGIENPFDEYQRMFATVLEGQLVVNVGMPDEMVIPEGYYSTVRLTNNAGLNPGQDALLQGNLVPVTNRITGEVILGPLGRPFYRHVPIEPFTTPQPLTFDGFDYRGWGYYRFMRFLDGLLNYAVVIPEPQIVEPECVPDTAFFDNPYVIQQGDTIYDLAQEYGAFTNDIIAANCIDNPALIVPGQIINLPPAPATPEPAPPVEVVEEPVAPAPVAPAPVVGPPASIGTVGTPTTVATVGGGYGSPMAVQLLDAGGLPVPNVPVTFTIIPGVTALQAERPLYASTSLLGRWQGVNIGLPVWMPAFNNIMALLPRFAPNNVPLGACATTHGAFFDAVTCSTEVTINTGTDGIATAPALTAGTLSGTFSATATGGGISQNFNFTANPGNPSRTVALSFPPMDQEFKVVQTYKVTVTDDYGNVIKTGSPTVRFDVAGDVEYSTDGGTTWSSIAVVTADADGVATVEARATGLLQPTIITCYGTGAGCIGTQLNTNLTNVLRTSATCEYTATTNAELAAAVADTKFCETTTITVSGSLTMDRSKVYGDVTFSGGTITSTNTNGSSSSALIDGINTACITISGTTLTGENGTHVVWTSASGFPASNAIINSAVSSAKDCGALTLNSGTTVTGNGANFILLRGFTIDINTVTVSNNPNTPTAIYGGKVFTQALTATNNGNNVSGDHVQVYDDSGFFNSVFASTARAGDAGIYVLPSAGDYTPTAPVDIAVSNNDFDSMGTGFAALCNNFDTNIGFSGNNFIDDMNWGMYLHTTGGTAFCNVTGIAFQVQFGNTTANSGNCYQNGNVTADVAAPC
jgi:hypothetical protein